MIAEPRVTREVALGELARCAGAGLIATTDGPSADQVLVTDVVHDSRQVGPGHLFVCIRGTSVDGHDLAVDAVAAGAVALVVDHRLEIQVPQLHVDDTRVAMAPIAACFFGHPAESMTVIGVTGTNGKTTVVHLLRSILEQAGTAAATIGTLTGGHTTPTTPEAPELQRRLAALVARGTEAVAIEISSHALSLHRVDAIVADVAVFTNLSRDHLDFHASMDTYFQAKARLFTPAHARQAVVNLDDPHGRLLYDAASIPTIGYRLADATQLQLRPDHSSFVWEGQRVTLPLVGRANVSNALAAATVARLLAIPAATIADGLDRVEPVRGRFERVDLGAGFEAMVDYAHTPDALSQLLETANELTSSGRVHLVVGCGGDKDRTKRVPMGDAAARLADHVVLTSDNPRSEDPYAIIDEMRAGMATTEHVEIEADRRRAIRRALAAAEPGDLVVIAGKGHETEQIVGDQTIPFDDRVVVIEEWERLNGAER